MRKHFSVVIVFVALSTFLAGLIFPALAIVMDESVGNIPLPNQQRTYDPARQMALTLQSSWSNFSSQHGGWQVYWNEATRTPHRAFGPAISTGISTVSSAAEAEQVAWQFLNQHATELGLRPENLQMQRATQLRGKWYLTFRQTYQGFPVLFSEVELRLNNRGEVMAFGVDFFPEIQISTEASLSPEAAKTVAISGIDLQAEPQFYGDNPSLAILPIIEGRQIDYHLVYKVQFRLSTPPGNFIALVDAQSGALLWRLNRVRYATVVGTSKGMVQLVLPTDPFVERPLADQYINIAGVNVVTDSLGYFLQTINNSVSLTAGLTGPFVNVIRDDGVNASFFATVNPGDSVVILWDDNNSHPAERDAFYHTNLIHHFITTLDPGFTNINYSMPCTVNINSTCNAFWDGTGINFFRAGNGCPNTAQMPSVVYHEYTHGINDKLYEQLGSTFGMINGATHEGMADVQAALLEDDPRIGRGFTGVGSFLRTLDNTNRYPEDNSGEPHHDGLIIGGAFWHLRVSTSLELARQLSHFAKYGLPDDLDNGVAFAEWYLETLIADDNDGDLGNGTPHFTAITNAFNAHGIGSALYMQVNFSHTPVPDTPDTTQAYPVTFSLSGLPVNGGAPDSLAVIFSTDKFITSQQLPVTETTPGNYFAEIPPQSAGTIVQYYISAHDPISGETVTFPYGAPQNSAYSFLVGFQTFLLDEMEVESGWTVGAPDDNATTGIWERADPQPTFVGISPVQPNDDHTANGTMCFVTGAAAGASVGANDVDNGKTTLLSPTFDLSSVGNPVIRYYKWYSNDMGASPNQDYWVVDISSDGGLSWVNVENTNLSTDGWEKVQFRVADYVTPTSTVKLRFVASDFAPGSLVEALIDDFEILTKSTVTSLNDPLAENPRPETFHLSKAFPNPFNPETHFEIALPERARLKVQIFNALGQRVKTLLDDQKSAGYYRLIWKGENDANVPVSSGIYFLQVEALPLHSGSQQPFYGVQKLILIR